MHKVPREKGYDVVMMKGGEITTFEQAVELRSFFFVTPMVKTVGLIMIGEVFSN